MYVFVCKLLWINNYLLCYKLFSVYKSLKRDGKKIKEIEIKEKYGKKSKYIYEDCFFLFLNKIYKESKVKVNNYIICYVCMYLYVSCYE